MKLSTRGRYGTRALLDLALHHDNGPVLIKDIARRQDISPYYLEQIIVVLKTAGLVKTVRGAKGGITLARQPAQIKLGEALQALEGSVALVECVENAGACPRAAFCVTRDIWVEMKQALNGVLDSRSLQDLVEISKEKMPPGMRMYHI